MIVTNNKNYYKTLMQLKNHGQSDNYEHKIVGTNSRLDNLVTTESLIDVDEECFFCSWSLVRES